MAKFILFLFFAALLIFFSFQGTNLRSVINEMFKARFVWVFLSFLISAVALVSRAYRWNLLIEPLNHKPPLRKTFYAVATGYFANLAFPRLGEVTRCGSLSKSQSIPFNVLLGTVITERMIDVISLLICLLITTAIEFKRLSAFISSDIIKPIGRKLQMIWSSPFFLLFSLALIAIALIFFLRWRKISKGRKGEQSKFMIFKGVIAGIESIRKLKRPWTFVFHSALIWFLYYMSVYVALFAMPQTEHLGFTAALFLLVAGGIGMSTPVQGGIGAYHLLVSRGLILYGINQQHGLAFATLLHSLQIVMILLLGSVSLIFLLFEKPKTESNKQSKAVWY